MLEQIQYRVVEASHPGTDQNPEDQLWSSPARQLDTVQHSEVPDSLKEEHGGNDGRKRPPLSGELVQVGYRWSPSLVAVAPMEQACRHARVPSQGVVWHGAILAHTVNRTHHAYFEAV